MSIEVIKRSGCHIIKHQEKTLDIKEFLLSYSKLEDLTFRQKRQKVICDMSSIESCKLTSLDFDEIKVAMFHIFINAPANFQLAVAVKCEQVAKYIENCHNQIRKAGYPHNSFITTSLDEALLRCVNQPT